VQKAKEIEGQTDHAFRVCKEKDSSGRDLNFSGDRRFKSLNETSVLYAATMENLLIDMCNVTKKGEI